jgi:hypothetical protein
MALLLLDSADTLGGSSSAEPDESDLLRAMLDAIHGEDDELAGMRMTRLTSVLAEGEINDLFVESTLGFGELVDGAGSAKLLVGGEIITAANRVDGPANFKFWDLQRGLEGSQAIAHPVGTLIFDLSENASAFDHAKRGFFVDTALGTDLDVVGRNLGLKKCPGITDAQWRAIIKAVAYLPKQTIDAFNKALLALFLGDDTSFDVTERLITHPYRVFVQIAVALATALNGRFLLNSGEAQLTTGANSVDVDYSVIEPPLTAYPGYTSQAIGGRQKPNPAPPPDNLPYFDYPASGAGTAVVGVYDDTPITRRGYRDGFTNYFLPGGSVAGNTITLGTSPGGAGTAVLVDYVAFSAHYLAEDETQLDDGDFFAYLSDPLLAAQCLLGQIREAGVKVELSIKL